MSTDVPAADAVPSGDSGPFGDTWPEPPLTPDADWVPEGPTLDDLVEEAARRDYYWEPVSDRRRLDVALLDPDSVAELREEGTLGGIAPSDLVALSTAEDRDEVAHLVGERAGLPAFRFPLALSPAPLEVLATGDESDPFIEPGSVFLPRVIEVDAPNGEPLNAGTWVLGNGTTRDSVDLVRALPGPDGTVIPQRIEGHRLLLPAAFDEVVTADPKAIEALRGDR